MSEKDRPIEKAIETVIKGQRIGRKKVICKVQRLFPELGSSRIRRVYEKKGYSLFKKPKKRRNDVPPNPIEKVDAPLKEWAMDFMSDALITGRRIRTFNVIDHFNRQCMTIVIDSSLPALRIIAELDRIIEKYGKPIAIRTDWGPEFTSRWFQKWLQDHNILWKPIQKGKPAQNGIIERFNRTFREQVLDQNLFLNIEHAQEITDQWVNQYNQGWPHESLGFKSPMEYAEEKLSGCIVETLF